MVSLMSQADPVRTPAMMRKRVRWWFRAEPLYTATVMLGGRRISVTNTAHYVLGWLGAVVQDGAVVLSVEQKR